MNGEISWKEKSYWKMEQDGEKGIGNGERISIGNHRWLPKQNGFKTWSTPKVLEPNVRLHPLFTWI